MAKLFHTRIWPPISQTYYLAINTCSKSESKKNPLHIALQKRLRFLLTCKVQYKSLPEHQGEWQSKPTVAIQSEVTQGPKEYFGEAPEDLLYVYVSRWARQSLIQLKHVMKAYDTTWSKIELIQRHNPKFQNTNLRNDNECREKNNAKRLFPIDNRRKEQNNAYRSQK